MSRTEVLKKPMAKPTTAKAAPGSEDLSREERLVAWLKAHQTYVLVAAGALALVVLATWFLATSSARKEAFARSMLEQAWALQDAGNLPSAAAELQRVVTTYRGTDAAHEAVLSLNQARLQMDQAQLAVDDLRTYLSSNPPARYQVLGHLLLAGALEDLGRPAEAAPTYETAAAGAEMDFLKADALVSAARAWVSAGDTARAVAALQQVIERYPETASFPVAQLRLGQLGRGG